MPPDWIGMKPVQFKVSLAPLDDMGFPFDRSGMVATVPQDVKDHPAYAKEIGWQVENTVRMILGLDIEEKND